MDFVSGFFYVFSAVLLFAALRVITARNPVHAVLYLMLAFSQAAALWLLLKAEFLGIALVLVYLGAVMVLFLFVVMMLDIDFAELRGGFMKNLPLGLALAAVFLAELVFGIGAYQAGNIALGEHALNPARMGASNIQAVGELLYTRYIFLFESAGVVLLVAMVGAIVLTHRKRAGVRPQNIGSQVRRRPEDATRNTQPAVGQGVQL